MLTGHRPSRHGIVANGWLFRETMEVRFWQQSNRLLEARPVYSRLREHWAERGKMFHCAKLFWWFNQGADVTMSVTPKPWYGADGNKVFGITGVPADLPADLEKSLGPFPFQSFWGPMAGLPATEWIARCAVEILVRRQPHLTLVYLPHLDYDPQRHGPEGCDLPKVVKQLDDACAPLLDAARSVGARVWIVSEYGHCQVDRPVYLNRELRMDGLLEVRRGPFGEMIDAFTSPAIAVCDHQIAHIYVNRPEGATRVRHVLEQTAGVAKVYSGDERADLALYHPRSGDLVALSEPRAWFAYPYWLDDLDAPDFARTVDIHRKPGFDPCELFFDPKLRLPTLRAAWRLAQKKLGFRTLFDVIPLDACLVRGSHGLPAADPLDRPILAADGAAPSADSLPMTAVYDLLWQALAD